MIALAVGLLVACSAVMGAPSPYPLPYPLAQPGAYPVAAPAAGPQPLAAGPSAGADPFIAFSGLSNARLYGDCGVEAIVDPFGFGYNGFGNNRFGYNGFVYPYNDGGFPLNGFPYYPGAVPGCATF